MTITVRNGINEASITCRPWSPAGTMNSILPNIRTNLEWAISRRTWLDTYLYQSSSITSAITYYFPPIPATCNWKYMISRTTPISYWRCRYANTYSSLTIAANTYYSCNHNYKYFAPYMQLKATANWDSTAPVRVLFFSDQYNVETNGYPGTFYSKPGLSTYAAKTLDNAFPVFTHADSTGVDAGEYNALRLAAIKATEIPVLQSAGGSYSTYYTFSSWAGLSIPVCVGPDSPAAQRVLTIIFYLDSDGPEMLKVLFGGADGQLILPAKKSWYYTGGWCEYRVDLTPGLTQFAPMYQNAGRTFYQVQLNLYDSMKSTAVIYSWAAYTGIPEGPYYA